jgi:hypothetical protein
VHWWNYHNDYCDIPCIIDMLIKMKKLPNPTREKKIWQKLPENQGSEGK